MEDYNKIIESLGVRYLKSRNMKIAKPVTIKNHYDIENTIFIVNNGDIFFGDDQEKVSEGDMLFIPGGKSTAISYGSLTAAAVSNEDFVANKKKYLQNASDSDINDYDVDGFSQVMFEAKVFDSVNFFSSLNITPFAIRGSETIANLIRVIIDETNSTKPGKNRIIKVNTEYLCVEIIRYILDNRLFVEQLVTNSTYFKDPRLIDIFAYIKANTGGDLSNKVLASVAGVSEDYVGQYFKMLTGINPQDYIEYQRMEAAVDLLRTTKKSIRDIGREVGYKDTAYFCRRFKMMFGIPAGKMRRRESLINV
uniref:AraC family transcriptional regulator n=1 Tax=Roseivirga sp. TaxID=1964215 RepID=UPI0040482118